MLSPTNGWAVGFAPAAGGQATIIHWDGSQWTSVPGPTVGAGGYLNSVYMVSPTDGWAVGLDGAGPKSLIVHWDGVTWDVVATLALPPTLAVPLRSVFMVGPLDGWIVSDQGLILHYGPESVPGTTTSTSTTTSVTTLTNSTTVTGTTTTSMTVTCISCVSTSPTTAVVSAPIPGFPVESILAGLLGGLIALTVIRRRHKG